MGFCNLGQRIGFGLANVAYIVKEVGYGVSNLASKVWVPGVHSTGLPRLLSPVIFITITGVKSGARIGKTVESFASGGWSNPVFYANVASAGLSGASFSLQTVYLGSGVCPAIAIPLYGASQLCSVVADGIDYTLNLETFFF
jgi:hypothetical protein